MVRRRPGRRSRGITLIEILIGIMIMGIGLISLATLFPIGLLRLREAQRQSRSAYLLESAGADLATRGLFSTTTFINPYVSPWYFTKTSSFDPWIQDTPSLGGDWAGGGTALLVGAYSGLGGLGKAPYTQPIQDGNPPIAGPGLPVAYDPLWRYQTIHPTTGVQGIAPNDPIVEARFGAGVGPLRLAGADGLQRLTNLQTIPATNFPTNVVSILQAFVSPEDVVWQEASNPNYTVAFSGAPGLPVGPPSTVVPDLSIGPTAQPVSDWRYTWMFTGQRTDTFTGTVYDGSIVVFENRPFSIDAVNIATISDYQVAGEPVVLAVFGYSGLNAASVSVGTMIDGTTVYYGSSNNTVLLFWPTGVTDPEIKPGSWIADVTYERQQQNDLAFFQFGGVVGSGGPAAQRCYWYQVSRVTAPADLQGSAYSAIGNGRYIFVSTSSPLKAKTLLKLSGTVTVPYHVNAALVSTFVVNVIPRTFVVP